MEDFMKKLFEKGEYTKKWHLYSEYVAFLCSLYLIYRNWFYEANAISTVFWIFLGGLSLYRLKFNDRKFNDG